MSRKSERQRLADMIDAGERAIRHLGRLTAAEFEADELRRDAVARALEVVGEACKHLTRPTRDRCPGVPWREVAAMRDRLIHGYDTIDWVIVWDTVTRYVPAALPSLRALYAEMSAEEPVPEELP
jgi:uncharacterized protein with HEPN domain